MCDIFREEFRLANFGLSHKNQSDFISGQWNWHPSVFIVYRVIVAAYVTGFFITTVTLFSLDGNDDFMAYLTLWTYLMLTLYFLFSAIAVVFYTCAGKRHTQYSRKSNLVAKSNTSSCVAEGYNNITFVETDFRSSKLADTLPQESNDHVITENSSMESLAEEITLFMKICWTLGNIVQVFAIIVTVIYFTALFPSIGYTNCTDINLHGVNSFLILVDTCLTARPVRLLHVIYPVIYGACYLIFSAVYWSFDNVNHVLYPGVLDWNYPGTTALWVSCLTFVAIPLLQLLYFGAYRLKLYISCTDK